MVVCLRVRTMDPGEGRVRRELGKLTMNPLLTCFILIENDSV